jgi:hypothetical protein
MSLIYKLIHFLFLFHFMLKLLLWVVLLIYTFVCSLSGKPNYELFIHVYRQTQTQTHSTPHNITVWHSTPFQPFAFHSSNIFLSMSPNKAQHLPFSFYSIFSLDLTITLTSLERDK